jgi:hypothetical protein
MGLFFGTEEVDNKISFYQRILGIAGNISFSVADPIKLLFFANEEFFRFLLVSLHVCYIEKKFIACKMI